MLFLNYGLRVTEMATLTNQLGSHFSQLGLETDVYLSGLMQSIEANRATLINNYNRTRAKSKLRSLDLERDAAYRDLYCAVKGFMHHRDADKRASATLVQAVVKRYGLTASFKRYDSKTGQIDALLNNLAAAEVTTALDSLDGLTEAVTHLQAKQEAFVAQRLAYQALVTEDKEDNASHIKNALVVLLNKQLFPYLYAMAHAQGGNYAVLNEVVTEIVKTINTKTGRRKDEVEKEAPEAA